LYHGVPEPETTGTLATKEGSRLAICIAADTMASMSKKTRDPEISRAALLPGGWTSTLREAVDWVFFAAAFGILFNLYDADGIELKVDPRPKALLQHITPAHPADYPGFKPSAPTRMTRPLAEEDNLLRLSLEGAKSRYGKVLFVDARPERDYREGHIRGALSFDVNDFERAAPRALPLLPAGAEILVYCSGGDCDDSVMLARRLREMGYKDVKLFEDGFLPWKKAGLPVATGDAP